MTFLHLDLSSHFHKVLHVAQFLFQENVYSRGSSVHICAGKKYLAIVVNLCYPMNNSRICKAVSLTDVINMVVFIKIFNLTFFLK